MVNSPAILGKIRNVLLEGLALVADPASGFQSAYTLRYNTEPISGEAHLFDAVTLLGYAFAVQPDNESLDDTILRIVDGEKGDFCSWQPYDMATTIRELRQGNAVDLEGVTGEWQFDSRNHSSVLNTIYAHWGLHNDSFLTLEYLSTDGTRRATSSLQLWEMQSSMFQQFNRDQEELRYGALEDKWAVIVSASDTWTNYRHQADAYAMYQLLKRHGYDDDRILLVAEDNIAFDSRNLYSGRVFVTPGGEDVYAGLTVDYKLSELTIGDLGKIFLGNPDGRLNNVLNSSANDNVIVFWCGHGNRGNWPGAKPAWLRGHRSGMSLSR